MAESEEAYVLYRNRPDWADVVPVPQDDGVNPACPIAYSAPFVDAMDYFRAIAKSGEVSQRALDLTEDVIDFNAANYTVWHLRRHLLAALGADLRKELVYTDNACLENPKNYQVWYHRRVIMERLGDGSNELKFTALSLASDAKNYHCWTYRQWAMTHFRLFSESLDENLEYADLLIKDDVRNNSAWNHRFFVITSTSPTPVWSRSTVDREVDYTLDLVARAPNNESAWNYLSGIIIKGGQLLHRDFPQVRALCQRLRDEGVPSPFVLSKLLDIHEEDMKGGVDGAQAAAQTICDELSKMDSIRAKYWAYRRSRLQSVGK